MIIVFSELGGNRLLGKAREIADSLGFGVLAVCSRKVPDKPQKLISLGADEVISCNATTVNDWSRVLGHLIRNEKRARFVLLPSTTLGSAILGTTLALSSENIGSVADGVEKFDEHGASKLLRPAGSTLRFGAASDKVSLWSIRLNSVPEPFEDSSRTGKTEGLELPKEIQNFGSPTADGDMGIHDLTSTFTLLVGRKYFESTDTLQRKKLEELAEKYHGRLLEMSGSVQVVYGPCLAIEVECPLVNLPEFQSEVLSLNSSIDAPISGVAKLSVATHDVESVVDKIKEANHE